MSATHEIRIPKDTVNDDEVLITETPFATGDVVAEGDLILVYETSKASVDVLAPAAGCVIYRCEAGDYVPVGAAAAEISDDAEAGIPASASRTAAPASGEGPLFSEAAERLLQEKGLDPVRFAGRDLVGEQDVLAEAAGGRDGRIPLVIIGAGGHALVVSDLVAGNPSFRLLGYLDDNRRPGERVGGYPVLGEISEIAAMRRKQVLAAVNSLGFVRPDPEMRTRFFDLADRAGALLPPLVHPTAFVDPRAVLGRGVQVHAGAVVGPEAVVGDGTLINSRVVVSHHCRIGRHVHLAPGAVLAGAVSVGDGSLVGMGVNAYLGIAIGANCVIENGSDLFRSVPDGTRVGRRA